MNQEYEEQSNSLLELNDLINKNEQEFPYINNIRVSLR